ncbi:MAG: hypothetical protein ACPGJV_07635 [Bacteriovoracaceae bacterium]
MRDMPKEHLYQGVKKLVEESENVGHFLLPQQKLFTLFSVAFQYMLYRSTKNKGAYIIRIEDSSLADKLAKRSKDQSTRRFIQSLLLPRKVKYHNSIFYLDFFHIGSWNQTNEIPKEKIKGAIIVKNTNSRPMMELDESDEEADTIAETLPPNYFLTSLQDLCPNTVTIAYDQQFDGLSPIEFEFIPKEKERIKGVTINVDIE